MQIQGYDIDGDMIKAARQNAEDAGVLDYIHFQQRPVSQLSHAKKYGFVITNPPYGERLEEKRALPGLYQEFGKAFAGLDSWSCYMISKIYNGMLKTYFYQFMGLRPPKKKPEQ